MLIRKARAIRLMAMWLCLMAVPVAGAEAPTLTEVQQLKLRASLQTVEIAQLRLQLAQQDFDRARLDTQELLRTLQQPGYRLDLNKLTYVPVPVEPQGGTPKD